MSFTNKDDHKYNYTKVFEEFRETEVMEKLDEIKELIDEINHNVLILYYR